MYTHVYLASLSSASDTSTDNVRLNNASLYLVSCRVGLGKDEVDSWILIGEPSRKYPGIHFKKYAHTCTLVYKRPHCQAHLVAQLVGDINHGQEVYI